MNNETCANSSSEGGPKCHSKTEAAHIYCEPCRLATGGYQRYSAPRPKPGIATIHKLLGANAK